LLHLAVALDLLQVELQVALQVELQVALQVELQVEKAMKIRN
jgi:hypothetical protein